MKNIMLGVRVMGSAQRTAIGVLRQLWKAWLPPFAASFRAVPAQAGRPGHVVG